MSTRTIRSIIDALLSLLFCFPSGHCSEAAGGTFAGSFLDDDEDEDGLVWPSQNHVEEEAPQQPKYYGPFFEPTVFPTNVSVLAGQTAVLQCRVLDLGDRVVSLSSFIAARIGSSITRERVANAIRDVLQIAAIRYSRDEG